MAAEQYIYISSGREGDDFTERLARDLADRGVIARTSHHIEAGTDWHVSTLDELKGASAVVVVVTSQLSDLDRKWIEWALVEGSKPIFPIVLEGATTPLTFIQFQVLDFSDYARDLQRLWEALPEETKRAEGVDPAPVTSQGYAFLSYAMGDAGFVESVLKPVLTTRRFTFWEYRSADRRYDVSLARELEDRIDNASAFVAVLSPDWKSSEWTERELLYAQEVERPWFLVRARPMRPSILLVGRLVIDFTVDHEAAGTKLIAELAKNGL